MGSLWTDGRRWWLSAVLLLTGVLCTSPRDARAQPSAKRQWVKAESAHTTVYSDTRPAKARDLLLAMEQLRTVMAHFAGPGEEVEPPVVAIAFDRKRDLQPYLSEPATGGVTLMVEYSVDELGTVMVINASEEPSVVLPWAYRAQLGQHIARRFPELPLWARSGLSHFYATLQIDSKGRVRLGRPDERHVRRLRDYSWIPFEQLFRITRDSAALRQGDVISQFQAQAWIATHYVMTGGGDRPQLSGRFYQLLGSGMAPEEAIREVFAAGLSEFEREVQRYARGLTLQYFTIDVPGLPSGDYPVKPVARDEVLLRLGRYLVRAIRPIPVETADAHLLPLVEVPELAADALMALAEVRERSGRPEEARDLYEKGLAADPKEASGLAAFARFLDEYGTAESLPLQRTLLERVTELAPWMGVAWSRLAATYGSDEAPKAAQLLAEAVRRSPDRPDFAYNLVIALLNAGDGDGARQAIERLFVGSDRRKRREQLEELLERHDEVAHRNREVGEFNAAIRSLNDGDRDGGRRRLQELLETVEDPALRQSIEETLERLGPDPSAVVIDG